MKKFSNKIALKQYKKALIGLIISILLVIIGIIFWIWKDSIIKESKKNIYDLNDIIISSEETKDYKMAYINNMVTPYKFAVYDNTTDAYYIVKDSKYLYIVYMSENTYKSLVKDKYTSPIKLKGITKYIPSDVKTLALEVYNDGLSDEKKITEANFNDYFGDIYLDMTESNTSIAIVQFAMSVTLLFIGFICLVINLNKMKSFNKLDKEEIKKLDDEMNRESSIYYKKFNLYLTDNYIITFSGKISTIKYSDIVWMYRKDIKTEGIKTAQCIILALTNGNKLNIVNSYLSKKSLEQYNQVWDYIINKNNNILVGYTDINIEKYKESLRKEVK